MPDSFKEENSRPGARRRRQRANRIARKKALAWWSQPGVLIFLSVVLLAAVGVVLVSRVIDRRPVRHATLGGLTLELLEARWLLDQMDHGENFQKPSTMMPDMPEWGKQRVSLDLSFHNDSTETQIFQGEEFFLVPEIGEEVPPIGAQIGVAPIAPGQTLNNVIHFDFDTSEPHGKLRVEWRRDGDSAYLAIPEPAEHYHLRPRGGEVALPTDARLLLPIGLPDRGEELYRARYGCIACHGDPKIEGTANVGPHLGSIGREAATRSPGKPPAQYIYESIIDPGSFIAPRCHDGNPCTEPSEMPEYASLVTLQHVADLVVYLLEQTAPSR